MPDTRSFSVVVEAGPGVIRKALYGAWKSAACPDNPGEQGRLPETMEFGPGAFSFGGFSVDSAQIQIPQDELDASFAPVVDGVELKIGLHMQVVLQDPPVPSAGFFDMRCEVRSRVPVGVPAGETNVVILLDQLLAGNVVVTLTSGDPLAANLDAILRDYVDQMYVDSEIPHHTSATSSFALGTLPVTLTLDTDTKVFNDASDPARAIITTRPGPDEIEISLPIYVYASNIQPPILFSYLPGLKHSFGVETRLRIRAPLLQSPGRYDADFVNATVTVEAIRPADAPHPGGADYTTNLGILGPAFEQGLASQIQAAGMQMTTAFGVRTIEAPTVAEIQDAISQIFWSDLVNRQRIALWTPQDVPEIALTINDVSTRCFNDMLAIGINAGGGDIGGLGNFIPAGQEFAIGISAGQFAQAIGESREDQGFADGDLPKEFEEDGKTVRLTALSIYAVDSNLRLDGHVTVVDAIAGEIDVKAKFRTDIGLDWVDEPSGGQRINSFQIGSPDVEPDQDAGQWLIALVIAILTGGLAGGFIIALVFVIVRIMVKRIAEQIGGDMVEDQVSGAAVGFGGWPQRLSRIGRVTTRFANPVVVDTSGMTVAGTMTVISSCEQTAIAFARTSGVYAAVSGTPLALAALRTHQDAAYLWDPGDGTPPASMAAMNHVYTASGFYVAKHRLNMQQPGGVATQHFSAVRIANVPPKAELGGDMVVREGEVVTLVGRFWDDEFRDTHETTWYFGDGSRPARGVVNESHAAPRCVGTSTVQHAWCDNGVYTVTFLVQDQDGGIAIDTLTVTVLNVSPVVEAAPDRFAYLCSPITLCAAFEDAGWCDSHRATWDFGDCTGLQTAIVRETNRPPATRGTATATHTYEKCGVFRATCVVVDDDGAAGQASTTISIVELLNPGFEAGFRELSFGRLGNHWTPYADVCRRVAFLSPTVRIAALLGSAGRERIVGIYGCEECVVHGGQRSQRVTPVPQTRWGLRQKIGANAGWCYQVSAWRFLDEAEGVTARLGLDPTGGDDPTSPNIVWTEREGDGEWRQLAGQVTAQGPAVTIFLEVESESETAACYFDDVSLIASQCPCCDGEAPPEDGCCRRPADGPGPEKPTDTAGGTPGGPATGPTDSGGGPESDATPPVQGETCVGFTAISSLLGAPRIALAGFVAVHRSGADLYPFAGPPGRGEALAVELGGTIIDLPHGARRVTALVFHQGRKAPVLIAQDLDGHTLAEVRAGDVPGEHLLEVTARDIRRVVLFGQDAGLYRLCAERDQIDQGKGEEDTSADDVPPKPQDAGSGDGDSTAPGGGSDPPCPPADPSCDDDAADRCVTLSLRLCGPAARTDGRPEIAFDGVIDDFARVFAKRLIEIGTETLQRRLSGGATLARPLSSAVGASNNPVLTRVLRDLSGKAD